MKNFTVEEKLAAIETLILASRPARRDQDDTPAYHRYRILKAIAADLQARVVTAPCVGLALLDRAINSMIRSKTALGFDRDKMVGLTEVVCGRWPLIRQALELFGDTLEAGESPTERGFRIGFEHAVAGGEEGAKRHGIRREYLPLVMYFDNEDDRREMIDAITQAKPGMVKMTIPERTK